MKRIESFIAICLCLTALPFLKGGGGGGGGQRNSNLAAIADFDERSFNLSCS